MTVPGRRSFSLTEKPITLDQARRSVLVVSLVLALIGAWQLYRSRDMVAYGLWGDAAAVLVCAAVPAAAIRFHRYWMGLATALGYVNSRILLSAIYYLLMTPIGGVLRLVGYDPLTRRGAKLPSYWMARAQKRQTRERFERAF